MLESSPPSKVVHSTVEQLLLSESLLMFSLNLLSYNLDLLVQVLHEIAVIHKLFVLI